MGLKRSSVEPEDYKKDTVLEVINGNERDVNDLNAKGHLEAGEYIIEMNW